MHSLATSLKSLFGRLLVLLITAMWLVVAFWQTMSSLPASLTSGTPGKFALLVLAIVVLATWWFLWPKLEFLKDDSTVNSPRATIGIFLLVLAVAGVPLVWYFVEPQIAGWLTPVLILLFVVCSPIGLLLIGASERHVTVSGKASVLVEKAGALTCARCLSVASPAAITCPGCGGKFIRPASSDSIQPANGGRGTQAR